MAMGPTSRSPPGVKHINGALGLRSRASGGEVGYMVPLERSIAAVSSKCSSSGADP